MAKRPVQPKPTAAGKDAAQPAATAPAEQLAPQPAGSTQDGAPASADNTGVAAPAAPVEQLGGAVESFSQLEAPAVTPPAKAVEGLEDDGEVEGLWITAIPEHGFRRCGYRFTRDGFGIALSALNAEQVAALESDPNLKVERGMFSGLVA